MNTKDIKRIAPYAFAGAAVLSAVTWLWQKTRVGLPEGAVPVTNFKIQRYIGNWYEIARFDYRFEKGLENVTAYYSQNEDGSVKVLNRGKDIATEEWKESTGKAKFLRTEDIARLKVSFFGPFYAAYNIIALDENYKYAMVAGNDLDYLWILSRNPEIPENIKTEYLKKASAIGYDVSRLIWTRQDTAQAKIAPVA